MTAPDPDLLRRDPIEWMRASWAIETVAAHYAEADAWLAGSLDSPALV